MSPHAASVALLTYFRWHRVVISHRGQEVDVTLDSGTQRMQAREGHQHLHMDPAVFFGGMETSHTGLGEYSRQQFEAPIFQVLFL